MGWRLIWGRGGGRPALLSGAELGGVTWTHQVTAETVLHNIHLALIILHLWKQMRKLLCLKFQV